MAIVTYKFYTHIILLDKTTFEKNLNIMITF